MTDNAYVIALAGNPNVGKSTVFNRLTSLHQHTGNWPGKTVASARGAFTYRGESYTVVDLPGTYSLLSRSAEEEIARDFLCSGAADVTLLVADATCLERNLNLVLQVLERTHPVVLCVNLMDEAEKKGIQVDLAALQDALGIPVVGTAARGGRGLEALQAALFDAVHRPLPPPPPPVTYPDLTGLSPQEREDAVASVIVRRAEALAAAAVAVPPEAQRRDRRLDRLLTSRATGIPVMLLLLGLVFWITIAGANAPSAFLSSRLFALQEPLRSLLAAAGLPPSFQSALVDGVYRTVAWVVSVMLPPMAIFFPLFTLLEDAGYLPRVAFNLDHLFRCAGAHGRQSLTMCMGFGCNACGVMGCRIIDSPRERLIAILTNSFVPCNGRFPTLIAILTIFFSAAGGGSLLSALLLLLTVVLSVLLTLLASWLLSKTVLRGAPSAFSLELPPYRRPQIGQVIVRSVLDRTLFVLGRAVAVAAPAGLLLWCLANIAPGGVSLLARCGAFLDPLGQLMGLDGMVLAAFLLGLPANEIVIPILLMGYLSSGMLTSYAGLGELRSILLANGWTWHTAVCMVLFTLFHFPCGTTCLTIRRETGSVKWTLLAIALPLLSGVVLCTAANLLLSLLPF